MWSLFACMFLGSNMLQATADAIPRTAEQLSERYGTIFKSGNRNAASHLWASYVLDRATQMPAATVDALFRGFCPISGSPIPDSPRQRFLVTLSDVAGGNKSGFTRHCCWPCICDEQMTVRTDTKTVQTADGPKQFDFLVIGDPCQHPDKLTQPFTDPFSQGKVTLAEVAPEVTCNGKHLAGATFSDHGHPIIGMFFTKDEQTGQYNDARALQGQCEARKQEGFNSGMGAIFLKVSTINLLESSLVIDLGQNVHILANAMPSLSDSLDRHQKDGTLTAANMPMAAFVGSAFLGTLVFGALVMRLRKKAGRSSDEEEGEHSSIE